MRQHSWLSSLPENRWAKIYVSGRDLTPSRHFFLTCPTFPPFIVQALRVRVDPTIIISFNNTDADASSSFLCSYVLGCCIGDRLVCKFRPSIHSSSCDNSGHRFHTDEKTQDEMSFMEYPNLMRKLIPTSLPTRSFLSFDLGC